MKLIGSIKCFENSPIDCDDHLELGPTNILDCTENCVGQMRKIEW